MCDFYQIWLGGFLISAFVLFGIRRYISHYMKLPKRPKSLSPQETRLIELMYSQLCSIHHLVSPIAVALIVGGASIYAVGLGTPNSSIQYENASIILLSFSMIFLYRDLVYLARIRKYEEVLGIRKVLKKFKLPSQ